MNSNSTLFDFFVDCVLITVGTELLQFQTVGGVATILRAGITRNPRRSFVGIGATLGTLKRNNNADALLASHNSIDSLSLTRDN